MTDPQLTIGVVGVGLIGASLALAARQALPEARLRLHDARVENAHAMARRIAGAEVVERPAPLAECDFVFVCTPVRAVAAIVVSLLSSPGSRCVVIDAASVKRPVIDAVLGQAAAGRFVPGHPMAGSARSGPQHASAAVLKDAAFVLTPHARLDADALERGRDLLDALGFRVVLVDPDEHDAAVSLTSHLPHALAYALALRLAEARLGEDERAWAELDALSGRSLRTITYFASANTTLWSEILLANAAAVRDQIERTRATLAELGALIGAGDAEALANRLEPAAGAARRLQRLQKADDGYE
jgi:prephenate dehydrogenase